MTEDESARMLAIFLTPPKRATQTAPKRYMITEGVD